MKHVRLSRADMYQRLAHGQDDAVAQVTLPRRAGMLFLAVLFIMATPLYFSAIALGSDDGGSSAAVLVKSSSDDDDDRDDNSGPGGDDDDVKATDGAQNTKGTDGPGDTRGTVNTDKGANTGAGNTDRGGNTATGRA